MDREGGEHRPSDNAGYTLRDTLASGTSFVSAPGCTFSSGEVACTSTGLASGATDTYAITVHISSGFADGATLSNSASVAAADNATSDPDQTDNTGSASVTVNRSADLSITKSGPATVTAGNQITYTLSVSNGGPSDAANVRVNDGLPAGLSNAKFCTYTTIPCTPAASYSTPTSLGPLGNGDHVFVVIRADVSPALADGTVLSNKARVSADTADPSLANNESNRVDTAVNTRAELSITKSDSPDPVIAGNNLTYTIVVTNNGPSVARSVSVSDPLPAGTSFVSADHGGTTMAGTVTWSLGDINPAATVTLTLVVKVDPARTTDLSNTATVSSTTTDLTLGNNSVAETTAVITRADVSITKADSVDPVIAGNNLTYTIVVTNNGPSVAPSVSVSDAVPAGTSFVSADHGGTNSAGTVTWSLGDFNPTDTVTLTLVVKVDPARTASLSNTATVTSTTADPTLGNNSATETTAVITRADVSITKADSVDPVIAGNNLTYTTVVTNNGPSVARSVSVSDPLPAGTSFVSADHGGTNTAGTVTWSLGDLNPTDTVTLTLVVKVDPARTTSLSNTASVSLTTTDPTPGNNSATETTAVITRADLSITKSDSPDPVIAGNNITYTIGVTNSGPSVAWSVSVSDPLPAGTSFVSADHGGTNTAGTVTWNLGDMTPGATATLTLVVKVDPSRTADVSNTATVSSSTTDDATGNNSAATTTAVQTQADLSITKTDYATTVAAGTSTTYTISVTNSGPSTEPAGVVVKDTIPANTTPSSPDCPIAGGVMTCTTTAPLTPGSSVSFHLTLAIPITYRDGGNTTLQNTATITSEPATDPNQGNNSSTDADTVGAATIGSTSTMTDSSFQLKDDLSPWTITDFEILLNAKNVVVATNPGQFYYHQRATNPFAVTTKFQFNLNWPAEFTSQTDGGQPIHAYVQLATDPANTWRDWTPQSTGICSTYQASSATPSGAPACSGQDGTITVNNVPAGAKVWVTAHLDFVPKGATVPSNFTQKPKTYGPFRSDIVISNQQSSLVLGASTSQTDLLGRGKKVTVVYGTMNDAAGNNMQNVWIRLTQGTTIVLTHTDVNGDYVFYDGQQCTGDGLDACSGGPAATFTFSSANNVSTTLAVLGQGGAQPALGAAPTMPAGKSSVTVSGTGANSSGLTNTISVSGGSASARNWTFS